jgi:ribonucleotide monophosphatase NagD (HAD superfamily)
MQISVNQFIQSHTPYQHFADQYPNVLIFSKDDKKCRHVAERYGFENVFTPTDINANFPDIWPFRLDHPTEFKKMDRNQVIDAAMVFNDPAYSTSGQRLTIVTGAAIRRSSSTWSYPRIRLCSLKCVWRNKPVTAQAQPSFYLRMSSLVSSNVETT